MKILGILNATPDSFSGSGEWEGCDVLDIGAESTRPGAKPISVVEEWKRLTPIIERHCEKAKPTKQSSLDRHAALAMTNMEISLDTRNPETAKKFAGQIDYLNDVSGFSDERMVKVATENNLKAIAMHSLTIPADPKVIIKGDAVDTVLKFAAETISRLHGLPEIIIDPGLGFGKSAEQSWKILREIKMITDFVHERGAKILVGHSRKSFISQLPPKERDLETAIISNYLQTQGVDYIRVHNVSLNKQALTIGEKLLHPQN